MIRLYIATDGRIRGLWSDDVLLGEIGVLRVWRASHVEFDERRQCWCVRAARHSGRVLHHSCSRTAALAWEQQHFGPGGPGWHESQTEATALRYQTARETGNRNENTLTVKAPDRSATR